MSATFVVASCESENNQSRVPPTTVTAPTAHDDLAHLDAIEASGLHLLVQADEWSGDQRADHPAVDGWMVFDEDNLSLDPAGTIGTEPTGGAPADRYKMKAASVATPSCGTSMIRCPMPALRYANYGVALFHLESDAEAEVFINNGFQDVVSARPATSTPSPPNSTTGPANVR
jgi:hypothetical protein